LGTEGVDAERVGRLAELMRASRGHLPSIAFRAVTPEHDIGEELSRSTARQLAGDTGLERDAGMGAGL
jgi:hypothetical protein